MSVLAVLGETIGKAGGAAVGQVVKDAGSAIGGFVKDIRAAITGDVVMSEESKLKLAEIADRLEQREQDLALAQVDINKLEAASGSLFIGGWRPAIGWVCALSLACYFVPKYVLAAVFWVQKCWELQAMQPYPVDGADLMELVFAMLGMATLRTLEKRWSVAKEK